MWLLSSYSYDKVAPCLPGLVEVSPEELRLEDYTARASGIYPAFLQSLEGVREKQRNQILLYANITPEEVKKLVNNNNYGRQLHNIIIINSALSPALHAKTDSSSFEWWKWRIIWLSQYHKK